MCPRVQSASETGETRKVDDGNGDGDIQDKKRNSRRRAKLASFAACTSWQLVCGADRTQDGVPSSGGRGQWAGCRKCGTLAESEGGSRE